MRFARLRRASFIRICCAVFLAALFHQPALYAAHVTLIINYPSISPNGDGVRDSFTATMIADSAIDSLVLTLENASGTETYDSLFFLSPVPQGEYSVVCSGLDSLGSALPEGGYSVKLYESFSGAGTTQSRTVIIDITPPSIWIDRIEPGTFSPGYPDPSASVTVYYGIAGYEEGAEAYISITDPSDATEIFDLEVPGDGVFGHDWDPGSGAESGLYSVLVVLTDEAGNGDSDWGGLYVDSEGPEIKAITPIPAETTEAPEQITGYCRDNSGVVESSLFMIWGQNDEDNNYYEGGDLPPDSTWWRGDTLFWRFDTPDTVNGKISRFENTYALKVYCTDNYEQSTGLTVNFTLDRTPPETPVILVTQSRVIETPVELDISLDQSDTDSLVIYRLYSGVTTSKRIAYYMPHTVDLGLGVNEIWVRAKDKAGNVSESSNVASITYDISIGISYPECFRSEGTFQVITVESADRVRIDIFDLAGELVRKLSQWGPSTRFELEWDLLNEDGDEVRNGAYLMVMTIKYSDRDTVEKKFIAVVR